MTPESQGCPARKGQGDLQELPATPGTQDFLVFLAKMVPQVPQVSPDATVQREREAPWAHLDCLDSREILDRQGCQA